MKLAGELDDRWFRDARTGQALGFVSGTGGKSGHRPASAGKRATRLVTPGGAGNGVTESATENKPPAKESFCDGRQGNLPNVLPKALLPVRVKRWGKSPPLVWQQTRHGKPRVVQGQIGGESRPGSPSLRKRYGGCATPSQRSLLRQAGRSESNPRVGCWSPGANRGLEE